MVAGPVSFVEVRRHFGFRSIGIGRWAAKLSRKALLACLPRRLFTQAEKP